MYDVWLRINSIILRDAESPLIFNSEKTILGEKPGC